MYSAIFALALLAWQRSSVMRELGTELDSDTASNTLICKGARIRSETTSLETYVAASEDNA